MKRNRYKRTYNGGPEERIASSHGSKKRRALKGCGNTPKIGGQVRVIVAAGVVKDAKRYARLNLTPVSESPVTDAVRVSSGSSAERGNTPGTRASE